MMQHIHLIGIGGSGLSAIARVLLESGYAVSGSDRLLSPLAHEVEQAGAQVYEGHRAENITGADMIVRSSAVPDDNPEVRAAATAGIPVLKRADFMGRLLAGKQGVAVAGTHGKTTTTAMVAWVFFSLGLDPSYIIGGVSKNLGRNAHSGSGAYFVIEADEYDRMFLGLSPEWILVTHLEHDHPDCYPSLEDYRAAFISFIHQLRPGGGLLTCQDHAETAALVMHTPGGCLSWTYGVNPKAGYFATDLMGNAAGGTTFTAWRRSPDSTPVKLGLVSLQVPGLHNVRNALAVIALAHRLNLSQEGTATALAEFTGTGRRFELVGEAGGVTFYSDYAHHPTEITATLSAARQRYPSRRIWAIWQPHTYSRILALYDEFLRCFASADQVIVTEIYAAREAATGFSAARLAAEMPHPAARFADTLPQATQILKDEVAAGDVVFILSAGDADQISQQVLDSLRSGEEHHD